LRIQCRLRDHPGTAGGQFRCCHGCAKGAATPWLGVVRKNLSRLGLKDDEDVSNGKLLPDSGSDDKDLAGLINTLFEELCPFLS